MSIYFQYAKQYWRLRALENTLNYRSFLSFAVSVCSSLRDALVLRIFSRIEFLGNFSSFSVTFFSAQFLLPQTVCREQTVKSEPKCMDLIFSLWHRFAYEMDAELKMPERRVGSRLLLVSSISITLCKLQPTECLSPTLSRPFLCRF